MTDASGWNTDMTTAPRGVPILVCRASDWQHSTRMAILDGGRPMVYPSGMPADRWREIDGPGGER